MIDLVPDLVCFESEYLAIGRVRALIRQVGDGSSSEGSEETEENGASS